MIKETITIRWPGINFFENVLLVLPVPAEYSEEAKNIMRECVYNAKLLEEKRSTKLQFITECEKIMSMIICRYDYLISFRILIKCDISFIADSAAYDMRMNSLTEMEGMFKI